MGFPKIRLSARGVRKAIVDGVKDVPTQLVTSSFAQVIVLGFQTIATLLVSVGVLNIDLSLRTFDVFGWANDIDRPNEVIRPDAVWKLPIDTTVRVKRGGFFTFYKTLSSDHFLSYTSTAGEQHNARIAPGEQFLVDDNCHSFTFMPMSPHEKDPDTGETLMTLLFTSSEIADCEGR